MYLSRPFGKYSTTINIILCSKTPKALAHPGADINAFIFAIK